MPTATRWSKADAALHGYHTVFWWAAGFYAFGAVLSALLFRHKDAGGSC
jgi:hypothetical protein